MPRHKKPPGTAVDQRNGQRADLTVAPATGVQRFDPPGDLCGEALEAWDAFWSDRPALLLTASGKVVLRRWVDALNRYLVSLRAADCEPLVTGSQGQEVINPLYKVAEQARVAMESCERQLGIGGLNASALGLAAIQERRSLADMNAAYSGGADGGNDRAEEEDPRLTIIPGETG
jgi:hypothetical protein